MKPYAVRVYDQTSGVTTVARFDLKRNAALHALCMEDPDTVVTRLVAVVEAGKITGWREVSRFP